MTAAPILDPTEAPPGFRAVLKASVHPGAGQHLPGLRLAAELRRPGALHVVHGDQPGRRARAEAGRRLQRGVQAGGTMTRHRPGTAHVAPLPDTPGWQRVVARGCGLVHDEWNGDYDCSHGYTWGCDDCPWSRFVRELHGPPEPSPLEWLAAITPAAHPSAATATPGPARPL